MGKIPNVDLTNGSIDEQIIPDEVYRSVTSGIGLAKTGSPKTGSGLSF
jgi:aldehyde:ferredoxin oxidoreductase